MFVSYVFVLSGVEVGGQGRLTDAGIAQTEVIPETIGVSSPDGRIEKMSILVSRIKCIRPCHCLLGLTEWTGCNCLVHRVML